MGDNEKIFLDIERLNLPASWGRFLIMKRSDNSRNQLNQTYEFIEKQNLDILSLKIFESVIDNLGINGLEMKIDDAFILLKYAKVKEIRDNDVQSLLKKKHNFNKS